MEENCGDNQILVIMRKVYCNCKLYINNVCSLMFNHVTKNIGIIMLKLRLDDINLIIVFSIKFQPCNNGHFGTGLEPLGAILLGCSLAFLQVRSFVG